MTTERTHRMCVHAFACICPICRPSPLASGKIRQCSFKDCRLGHKRGFCTVRPCILWFCKVSMHLERPRPLQVLKGLGAKHLKGPKDPKALTLRPQDANPTHQFRLEGWYQLHLERSIQSPAGAGKPQRTLGTIEWLLSAVRPRKSPSPHSSAKSLMKHAVRCHSRSSWVCRSRMNPLTLRMQPLMPLMLSIQWNLTLWATILMAVMVGVKSSKWSWRTHFSIGSQFGVPTMWCRYEDQDRFQSPSPKMDAARSMCGTSPLPGQWRAVIRRDESWQGDPNPSQSDSMAVSIEQLFQSQQLLRACASVVVVCWCLVLPKHMKQLNDMCCASHEFPPSYTIHLHI